MQPTLFQKLFSSRRAFVTDHKESQCRTHVSFPGVNQLHAFLVDIPFQCLIGLLCQLRQREDIAVLPALCTPELILLQQNILCIAHGEVTAADQSVRTLQYLR